MPRSIMEVEVTYFRPETRTVREKVKVRKKINGRWVTRYEYKSVKKTVQAGYSRILPVTPEQIKVSYTRSFDDRPTIAQRTYTAPGAMNPREIRLESFFTSDSDYDFTQRTVLHDPVELAKWFEQRVLNTTFPVRVRIRALGVSGFFHLRELNYETEGATSDLPYSMVFRERGLPSVRVTPL